MTRFRLGARDVADRLVIPEKLYGRDARALATQASLAVQLTRSASEARQSAVLEERNQLAGEIHDSQGFGISNMRSRVENIGAELEVRTAPDRGTTISIRLPIMD